MYNLIYYRYYCTYCTTLSNTLKYWWMQSLDISGSFEKGRVEGPRGSMPMTQLMSKNWELDIDDLSLGKITRWFAGTLTSSWPSMVVGWPPMEIMMVMMIDDDDNYDNDHLILPGQLLARVGVQLARPWVVVGRPQRWRASADPLCLWDPSTVPPASPRQQGAPCESFHHRHVVGESRHHSPSIFRGARVLQLAVAVFVKRSSCSLLDTSTFSFSSS